MLEPGVVVYAPDSTPNELDGKKGFGETFRMTFSRAVESARIALS